MNETRELLERVGERFAFPEHAFEGFQRRRDRKRRNQRITAGGVGIAIFATMVWIATTGGPFDRTPTPGSTGTGPSTSVPGSKEVDYVIDLQTGVKTPLPEAIIRSAANTGMTGENGDFPVARYAVSPHGSQLSYVGTDDEGRLQIFVASIDGTRVRQMTHDPTGARSPAWSPDGTRIVYEGYGSGEVRSLFVLEVATGESTQITDGTRDVWWPQFTPDGSSVIYTGRSDQSPVLLTVPAAGGKGTLLIGPGEGIDDAGNGSMSPDGSLVTFLGSGTPRSSGPSHCGPCRFVANADGTERRVIPGWISIPAGTWSPDGSRIVSSTGNSIVVVDVATGGMRSPVAEGRGAIWLDDHTLLVEV
jgi:Tol biopolymer transport system component